MAKVKRWLEPGSVSQVTPEQQATKNNEVRDRAFATVKQNHVQYYSPAITMKAYDNGNKQTRRERASMLRVGPNTSSLKRDQQFLVNKYGDSVKNLVRQDTNNAFKQRKSTADAWAEYIRNRNAAADYEQQVQDSKAKNQGIYVAPGDESIHESWMADAAGMDYDEYVKQWKGFYSEPVTSSYKNPQGVSIEPVNNQPEPQPTAQPAAPTQQPTTGYDWKSLQQQASNAAAGLTGQMAGSYEEIKRRIADSNGASYGMDEIAKPMEQPSNVPTAQNPQPPEVPIEDKKPYELTDEELQQMVDKTYGEDQRQIENIVSNENFPGVKSEVDSWNIREGDDGGTVERLTGMLAQDGELIQSFADSMGIEYSPENAMDIATAVINAALTSDGSIDNAYVTEQKNRSYEAQVIADAETTGSTDYRGNWDKPDIDYNDPNYMMVAGADPALNVSNEEMVYNAINSDDFVRQYNKASSYIGGASSIPDYLMVMNEQQKKTFNSLYNSGDTNAAMEYLDRIKGGLIQKVEDVQAANTQAMAKSDLGQSIAMYDLARLGNVLNSILFPAQAIAKATGNDEAYHYLTAFTRFDTNTQQGQIDALSEAALRSGNEWMVADIGGTNFINLLYGIVTSSIDSFTNSTIAGAVAKPWADVEFSMGGRFESSVPAMLVNFMMGNEVASKKMYDALSSGTPFVEALIDSMVAGMFEGLTEVYSAGEFFEAGDAMRQGYFKAAMTDVRNAFFGGGLEEVANDMLNHIYDTITGDQEGFMAEIAAREKEGDKHAVVNTLANWTLASMWSFVSGSISEGASAGANVAINFAVNSYERVQAEKAVGASFDSADTTGAALNVLETVTPKDGNGKYANGIQQAKDLLQTVNNLRNKTGELSAEDKKALKSSVKKLGRITGHLFMQAKDSLGNDGYNAVRDTIKAGIKAELEARAKAANEEQKAQMLTPVEVITPGQSKYDAPKAEKNYDQMADDVLTAMEATEQGKAIPQDVQERISQDEDALDMLKEQVLENGSEGEAEGTKAGVSAAKQIADEAVQNKQNEMDDLLDKSIVDSIDAKNRTIGGKDNTSNSRNVTLDGESGQVTGFTQDSKTGDVSVTVDVNGETRTVDFDDAGLMYESSGVYKLLKFVDTVKENFSTAELQTIFTGYRGGNAGDYVANVTNLYRNAYQGRTITDAMRSGLDADVADSVIKIAQDEAVAADQKRLKGHSRKEGKLDTSAVEGTKVWNSMTDSMKSAVQNLETLAKVLHVDIQLVSNDSREQGSYDSNTDTITINLNSKLEMVGDTLMMKAGNGKLVSATGHAIYQVAAHEITHYIEAHSNEGYKRLRNIIVNRIGQQQFNELVDRKLAQYSKGDKRLTYSGAVAEVIADACSEMLGDSKAIAQLAKADPEMHKTWKKVIGRFINGIRESFDREKTYSKIEALAVQKYANEIAQVWDEALIEAVQTVEAQQNTVPVTEIEESCQFELGADVEKTEDGLIAVHNMDLDMFMTAVQLGGFPMPSIAVIKAKDGHTKYGNVSIVFGKDTIDPKKNSANKLYGSDAWTPTFPTAEYEVNQKQADRLYKRISKIQSTVDPYFHGPISSWLNSVVGDNATSKSLEDIIYDAKRNVFMMAAFQEEKGNHIDEIKTESKPEYNENEVKYYDMIIDKLGEDAILDLKHMSGHNWVDKYPDALGEVRKIMKQQYLDAGIDADMASEVVENAKKFTVFSMATKAMRYNDIKTGNAQVKYITDREAMENAAKNQTDSAEYENWLREILDGVIGERGIDNGADRFTPSGNRRSFKQTHMPFTIENVVKAMKKNQSARGENAQAGATGLQSITSPQYKSIKDMKADSNRLSKVETDEYKSIINSMNDRIDKALNEVYDHTQRNHFMARYDAENALLDAARGARTTASIKKTFADYQIKLTAAQAETFKAILDDTAKLPTEYFQAKPERVVTTGEIMKAIIPSANQLVYDKLDKAGIPYEVYNGTDQDRLEKLNSVENVQFELDEDYIEAVNSGDMETAQKMVDEAAKKAGYSQKMYHGTPYGGFTVFKDWSYFTPNEQYADRYHNPSASSVRGRYAPASKPMTYGVYIKADNAFDTREKEARRIFKNEFYRQWGNGADLQKSGLPDWTDGYDFVEFFEENGYDYDAVYLDEGADGGYGDEVVSRGISLIVKDSAQIKSADPVTYDNEGNVIPLSERFNADEEDIRYSIEAQQYEFDKNLDKNLQSVIDGTFDKSQMIVIGATPKVLQDIGIFNKKIAMNYTHVNGAVNMTRDDDHNANTKKLKNIFRKINDPIGIIYSKTDPNSSVVVIVDEYINGKRVVAPVRVSVLRQAQGAYISLNQLSSVYGKTGFNNLVIDAISRQVTTNDIGVYYWNNKKATALREQGLQLPEFRQHNGVVHSITENQNFVKQTSDNIIQDKKNEDKQLSLADDEYSTVYDANEMLSNIDEGTNMTAGERTGLSYYKKAYGEYAKILAQVNEQRAILQDENASNDDKTVAQNRLNILLTQQDRAYQKVKNSMQSKGMQALSRRVNGIVNRYITGKTSEQIADTVDQLQKDIADMRKKIDAAMKRTEGAEKAMEIAEALSMFNQEALDGVVEALKGAVDSRMDSGKVRNKIIPIFLQMTQKDADSSKIIANVRKLAEELVGNEGYKEYGKFIDPEAQTEQNNNVQLAEALITNLFTTYSSQLMDGNVSKEVVLKLKNALKQQAKNNDALTELLQKADSTMNDVYRKLGSVWSSTVTTASNIKLAIGMANASNGQAVMEIAHDQLRMQKMKDSYNLLRSKAAQKLIEQQEKYHQMMKNDADYRKAVQRNNKIKRKISRIVKDLSDKLMNPTDYKNIQEQDQQLVQSFISTITAHDANGMNLVYDKKAAQNMMVQLGGIINENRTQGMVFDHESMEYLMGLEEAIYNINRLRNTKDEDTSRVQKANETAVELQKILEAAEFVKGMAQAGSYLFNDNKKRETTAVANEFIKNNGGKANKKIYGGKIAQVKEAIEKIGGWGNLTPEYFFRMIGDVTMTGMNENLHEAENQYGLRLQNAYDYLQDTAKQFNREGWDMNKKLTFKNEEQGRNVELTVQQAMSLYATWQREHTAGQIASQHLEKGGFVINVDKKSGLYHEIKNNGVTGTRVTANDMKHVFDFLTDEQKGYVNEIVRYMSNEMSDIGNEASLQMYGIRKYKESYYFPIKSSKATMFQRSDAGAQNTSDDSRMKNQGWTKSRLANAKNAVLLEDFDKVAFGHIQQMITYSSFVTPLESMNRLLNYKFETDDGAETTIRAMFEDKYGHDAVNYLKRYIADLNGGATRTESTPMDKGLSLFRKNAVAGSLSVTLQQPLSYIRAAYAMNPFFLAKAMAKDITPGRIKAAYDEMLHYSGVGVIKKMGRFDASTGMSAIEYMSGAVENEKGIGHALDMALNGLPELADNMTWARMWVAAKMETASKHKGMDQSSEEFLKLTAQLFNHVMRTTQVYDSVLVRSQNMRNKDLGSKLLTSFMAEPTLTANMLYDAALSPASKDKRVQMVSRASAAFVVSAVLQAAVKGMMGAARGDDEDRTFAEQFAEKFASSLAGEINPLNLIPGYNDMITAMNGGEVTNETYSAITNLSKTWKTTIETIKGIDKLEDGKAWYKAIENTAGSFAQIFTKYPVRNAMRDTRALVNGIFNMAGMESPLGGNNVYGETNASVVKYSAIKGAMNEDTMKLLNSNFGIFNTNTSCEDGLYNLMFRLKMKNDAKGAKELQDYIMLTSKAQDPMKSINDGVRTQVKNAMLAGDMTASQATNFIMKNCPYSGKNNTYDYTMKKMKEALQTKAQEEKQKQKTEENKKKDREKMRQQRNGR